MKILFVDDDREKFEEFLQIPFAQEHQDEIEYTNNPIGLPKVVLDNPDLRLIILDMFWPPPNQTAPRFAYGAMAMQDLAEHAADVPVVIYSLDYDDPRLQELFFDMLRRGAYDWISKADPWSVSSLRFERVYRQGRTNSKGPTSRSILPLEEPYRSGVHVATLFVDLSGFTALADMGSADELIDTLRHFYRLVSDEVLACGGYLDKYVGDEVMAVFGAAGNKDVSAGSTYAHVSDCIEAARRIQMRSDLFRHDHVEPVLKKHNNRLRDGELDKIGWFRMGIESGPVYIESFPRGNETELSFIGTPINIAARIIAQAEPGQIWIGENAKGASVYRGVSLEKRECDYKNLRGTFMRYRVEVTPGRTF